MTPGTAVPDLPQRTVTSTVAVELLQEMVRLTGALGGAAWSLDASKQTLTLDAQWGLGEQRLDVAQQAWPGHRELLLRAAQAEQPQTADANFTLAGAQQQLKLYLVKPQHDCLIELFFDARQTIQAEALLGILQLVLRGRGEAVAVSDPVELELAAFINRLHSRLDRRETSLLLVNELRIWLGVDRVALLRRAGHHVELEAISGLATFDPRSTTARQLIELAQQLPAGTTDELQFTTESLPAIEQHAVRNAAVAVRVWPLSNTKCVLVVENFDTQPRRAVSPAALQQVLTAAARSLSNSDQYSQLAVHPAVRWLRPLWSSTGMRLFTAVLLLAIVAACLSWIEVELVLQATGTLQPASARDIYAPLSAVVEQVHVKHGDQVNRGEPLLDLRSSALDLEQQKLQGELRTVDQQIADLETLRSDPARERGPGATVDQGADLAAREEEYKVLRLSLQQQLDLLTAQREELQLTSPIAGTVLTWNVEQLLQGRPIDPTQTLITVAALDESWELEVLVPAADVAALERVSEPVTAIFSLPARPSPQTVQIRETASEMRVEPTVGLVLPLRANIAAGVIPAAIRPGTQVTTRIHCGQAPLGYVWFRHAVDQSASWWNLRFPAE